MGTTLTGTTPQTTYDSLIKVTDNGPLGGSLKTLTDGLGNDSALALSTGAASVTGTLAVSSNLTVDTNTLFVDATNNTVGVGTTSNSYTAAGRGNLNIAGSGGAILGFQIGGSPKGYVFHDNTNLQLWNEVAGNLLFGTNATERLRIDSSGNVGIGTASPADLLHLDGKSNYPFIRFAASQQTTARYFKIGMTDAVTHTIEAFGPSTLINFLTSGSERVRIDSAGNFLVATTVLTDVSSSGAGNEGAYIKTDGQIGLATSNDTVGIFNRKTSAGTLLDFRYNGTSVGSIGVAASSSTISLEGGGIYFDSGASKYLDDYEEGTWTPVIRGSSTAGTYELGSAVAAYTKIGRQVTVTAQIVTAASVTGGGSGYAQITGLPFNNANQAVGATYVSSVDFSGSYLAIAFISSSGQNTVYFVETNDNAAATDLPISVVGGARGFNFTLTYFV